MEQYMKKKYETAVIIGGSIAGMLSALVLSDYFEKVLVLERDQLSECDVARGGVPQAHHIHALLNRGRLIVEKMMPGFTAGLIGDGAILIDHMYDRLRLASYGWQPRFPSELKTLMVTRILIEGHIRRGVARLSNVEIKSGCTVKRLIGGPDGRVTGLRYSSKGSPESELRELTADLIINAAGRGSNAPIWLKALGYGAVESTLVDAHWGYASRFYHRPETWPHDWKMINIWPQIRRTDAQKTRGGVLCQQDGRRCIVTLVGNAGDVPPRGEAGFLAFAESLASPEIADFIRTAEPAGAIVLSKTTVNRFHRYDQLEPAPDRFVSIGDAVGAFNPVYGQGMSTAAMEAETLAETLKGWVDSHNGLDGFSAAVQKEIVGILEFPWSVSTAADSYVEGCDGAMPYDAVRRAYVERVAACAASRPEYALRFEEMANLLRQGDWMYSDDVRNYVLEQWDDLGRAANTPPIPRPSIYQLGPLVS